MCLTQPRAIAAPTVAPAPTREQIAARANFGLVADNRNIVSKRQGIFGNVKTTPMGDASYGTNAVAKFG